MTGQTHPRVVYIAGWGRSGTTLVGGTLEAATGSAYIGELWNLWEDYNKAEERCSCGQSYRECDFWSGIIRDNNISDADVLRLHAIKTRRLGTRSLIGNVEKFSDQDDPDLAYYRQVTEHIYQGVARRTGRQVIVDASKTPNLIYLLSPQRSSVLHIVRDPRAVAYSWWFRPKATSTRPGAGTMARHGPLRSTLGWLARNIVIDRVTTRLKIPTMTVTYETFVGNHDVTMASIVDFARLPPAEPGQYESHSIRGNPARFSSNGLTIVADNEWKRGLPGWMALLIRAVAGPLMRRYGY